jgi:hypothetical protein
MVLEAGVPDDASGGYIQFTEHDMRRKTLYALIGLAAFGVSMQAVGDDSNSDRPIVSHKQMMKDCMAKEKQANPGASVDDQKKTCLAKIDSYNKHPSETTAPPNNP